MSRCPEDANNYVYTLAYPDEMGGKVFYIGLGRGIRIDQHETDARRDDSTPTSKIIRAIWSKGFQVKKTIVQKGLSRDVAEKLEMQLIKYYGYDNLVNTIYRGINREVYRSIPQSIILPIQLRMILEDHIEEIFDNMELELTHRNCYLFFQKMLEDAIRNYIEQNCARQEAS